METTTPNLVLLAMMAEAGTIFMVVSCGVHSIAKKRLLLEKTKPRQTNFKYVYSQAENV